MRERENGKLNEHMRIRVKESREASVFGMISGGVFACIGIFFVIPIFGVFGVFWTLITLLIFGAHAYNFFSKKGVSKGEIVVESLRPEREAGSGADDSAAFAEPKRTGAYDSAASAELKRTDIYESDDVTDTADAKKAGSAVGRDGAASARLTEKQPGENRADAIAASVKERLTAAERLRVQGSITEEEYRQMREDILRSV